MIYSIGLPQRGTGLLPSYLTLSVNRRRPMIIDGLKPGIYFGLAAELYHKDTALSRSDLVNLLDTPNSYWVNSWMNKNRPARIATDPMEYGEAFHTLLFEPEKFNRTYQILPIDEW